MVEMSPEGGAPKPFPTFPATRPEDVFGSLAYDGPPKSLAEMEATVLAEAKRRHADE